MRNTNIRPEETLAEAAARHQLIHTTGARLDINCTENDVRISLRAFYVDELTVDAPAEALPDKDVDIVLTHEEAQHIADQLFPWL